MSDLHLANISRFVSFSMERLHVPTTPDLVTAATLSSDVQTSKARFFFFFAASVFARLRDVDAWK